MSIFTPKQRMLNAYKGLPSDRAPVAPEFWYYYPAKILGISIMELEREYPFYKALQKTFLKYKTEGWGIVSPKVYNQDLTKKSTLKKIDEGKYLEKTTIDYCGSTYQTHKLFDAKEPSWVTKPIAGTADDILSCTDMLLSDNNIIDCDEMVKGYDYVDDDYLLEAWLGLPFFDFIATLAGFQRAIEYFMFEDEIKIQSIQKKYSSYQTALANKICDNTDFEAFSIGCSYSCNSLIGPNMWRKWDKPYIKAMADVLHQRGKLLHVHFHGKSIETVEDFKEIGIDCVCPFERKPGGDINGLEGILSVRKALDNKVTFNGNVHTVKTLIRGNADDVRREVREVKEAFSGSNRYIIGTGDQVGYETPEENIYAMVEEAIK